MSAPWETGASSGVQTTPADLKLYLGWLGFLISTHVLHMNILINHEYPRMLHILLNLQYTSFHMFKFLLGPWVWRNKTKERYFSTVPKIIAACFIPPNLGISNFVFLLWNNDLFLFLNHTSLYLRIFKLLKKTAILFYSLAWWQMVNEVTTSFFMMQQLL